VAPQTLLGLRYPREIADQLMPGETRFGQANPATRAQLDAISDVARLERLAGRLLTASTRAELLADQP